MRELSPICLSAIYYRKDKGKHMKHGGVKHDMRQGMRQGQMGTEGNQENGAREGDKANLAHGPRPHAQTFL